MGSVGSKAKWFVQIDHVRLIALDLLDSLLLVRHTAVIEQRLNAVAFI